MPVVDTWHKLRVTLMCTSGVLDCHTRSPRLEGGHGHGDIHWPLREAS